ncbi:MAG: LacI family DNA-binding transcriptional regulator [Lachnospiraceae bacterium]|nr:LacI family DNA-binding transcriptional regulator [Lachnospiraceae bacterium]
MKVSIKKISEATGFSPATISNALNYKKGVNKETSAQIFRIAKEMGYIEENRITKIKFVIFRRNGSIVDDTPFFPLMIDGVEKECRTCGFEMVICNLNFGDADYEEQVKWIINDTAAAVILLGTELMEEDLDIFRGAKCPLLTFDYWCSDMSFNGVLINNSDSARMAVEYLIGKGHKKIGYLRGSFRIKAFRSRAVGYQVALSKYNIPLERKYTISLSTTMDGAYKDMLEYLKGNPELPTAFFSDNDMIAIGAAKALQERGYKIPGDISIIGFDDLPFCEIMSPRLTTLRVSKQEMGQLAVRRISDMIKNGGDVKTKLQVCTQFVERDSVKDLNE